MTRSWVALVVVCGLPVATARAYYPGIVSVERTLVVGAALQEATDIVDIDIESLLAPPQVVSASKREQSSLQAPAAVTVIDRAAIEVAAVDNVAELLRRVPGAYVLQPNANAFSIGLRGVNNVSNNRVLVLVDGRQVAETNIGYTPWGALPLAPGDVERIEVIRGPSSTLYGADALTGVVSIVTRRPRQSDGIQASVSAGSFFVPDAPDYVRNPAARWQNGGRGQVAWGWLSGDERAGVRGSLGFQHNPETGSTETGYGYVEGPSHLHALLSGEVQVRPDLKLFASASHVRADHLHGFEGQNRGYPLAIAEQALVARMEASELLGGRLRITAATDARRLLLKAEGVSTTATTIQRTSDLTAHGLLQADLALLDHRNVLTLLAETTTRRVKRFFETSPQRDYQALAVQNELVLLADRSLTLNVGVRAERVAASDAGQRACTFRHVNPRAAFTWQLDDARSLRLAGGTAFRTPSPMESYVDIVVPVAPPPQPPNVYVRSNPRVRSEELHSLELGYRGLLAEAVTVDVAWVAQRVSHIVGFALERRLPMETANLPPLQQIGAEVAFEFAVFSRVGGYAHYALWLTREEKTGERNQDWPTHIAGAGVELRLPQRLRLTLDAYGVVGAKPRRLRSVDRLFVVGDRPLADQAFVTARLGYLLPGQMGEVYVAVRNIAGYGRRYSDLRHLRAPHVNPIGASTIIGVRLK
jgi:outer membrane receptor protein involved in Fe transport